MKVLKVIKNVILTILGIIFFTFALAMTILLLNYNDYGVTQFGDTTLVIIGEEISSEDYNKGDLVLVKKTDLKNIAVGDSVFAYFVDKKGSATVQLGVVGEVYEEDDAISYENGQTYAMDFVVGKKDKVYKNVGKYLSVIESKWGFLFIILVPCFFIFIYEIYALIVEIKYGADKDTD